MARRVQEAPLLDAVFAYLHFIDRDHTSWMAPAVRRPSLAYLIGPVDRAELADALARATSLRDGALSYGDTLMRNLGDEGRDRKIQARMRTQHPGFSDRSYTHALLWGCFIAR